MTITKQLKACKKLKPEEAAKALMAIVKEHFMLPELPVGSAWNHQKKQRYYEKGHRFDLEKIRTEFGKAFKRLGAGAFSAAYVLQRGWVIKINDRCWTDSPTDGWFDWAKVMIENQKNPFFTRLASVEREDGLFIAIAERLKHEDSANPGGYPLEELATEASKNPGLDIAQAARDIHSGGLIEMVNRDAAATLEVAKLLVQTKEILNSRFDMHGENTMVRKGGWPVINDPFPDTAKTALAVKGVYSWVRSAA